MATKKAAIKDKEKLVFSFKPAYSEAAQPNANNHKEKLEQADLYRRRAMLAARRCMNLKAFEAYRMNYDKAREGLFDALLNLPFVDPVMYAIQCKDIIDRIRNIGVLLDDVKSKALGKGKKA